MRKAGRTTDLRGSGGDTARAATNVSRRSEYAQTHTGPTQLMGRLTSGRDVLTAGSGRVSSTGGRKRELHAAGCVQWPRCKLRTFDNNIISNASTRVEVLRRTWRDGGRREQEWQRWQMSSGSAPRGTVGRMRETYLGDSREEIQRESRAIDIEMKEMWCIQVGSYVGGLNETCRRCASRTALQVFANEAAVCEWRGG